MYKCMQGCRKWGGRGSQDRPSLKAREAWPLILHAHTNVHGPKTGKHLLHWLHACTCVKDDVRTSKVIRVV